MKSIKKILVPTDFSDNAEPAYHYAQDIAARFGARVDFMHVIPTLAYFSESLSRMEAPLDSINEELYPTAQKEAGKKLDEVMDRFLSEETQGEQICNIERKPAAAILRLAEEKDYDLIVMASKGQHGSHLLRGSTTDKVIRQSVVPVLSVDNWSASRELKRIMLPTDGSEISFSALPLALALADVWEAEIIFYHVHQLYGTPLDNASRDPEKSEEENIFTALLNRIQEFLAENEHAELAQETEGRGGQFVVAEGASSKRINFHVEVERGVSAHRGIEDYAAEYADIVVMATHGHSGLTHFFLGSTTEKVARTLDMPVLTVRPKALKVTLKNKKGHE